jgi:hypothetical protein
MVYQKVKTKFNFYIDRAIDWTDTISTRSYSIQSPIISKNVRLVSQTLGDYGRVVTDFPRLDVFEVTGSQGCVIYIGHKSSSQVALMRTLFPGGYRENPQGRVALWQLSLCTQQWLQNADLVVCKVSRKFPVEPEVPYSFYNPIKIRQTLTIDKPLDELLESIGEREIRRDIQRNIRQVQDANFTYRFSHSIADFDHFYHAMYLPTIKDRFGEAANVTAYEGLLKYGMNKGGLLLLMLEGQAVAGSLMYIQNRTCFMLVGGILNNDSDLVKQGVNTAFYWYGIQWAISEGARSINFGATNAWQSDGVFYAKRRWGAKVVSYLLEHSNFLFLANKISPEWRAQLNKTGFLTGVKDKYLQVSIDSPSQPYTPSEIEKQKKQARNRGLDGIQIVTQGKKQNYFNDLEIS